jgi:hypothetical protein
MQKLAGLWIDNRDFYGGGSHVHADPQIVLQIAHSGLKDRKMGQKPRTLGQEKRRDSLKTGLGVGKMVGEASPCLQPCPSAIL